jgi:RmuC family
MHELGLILAAAALGLGLGAAAVAVAPRRAGSDEAVARLETRLEIQSAEMRRLADSGVGRDAAGEQLRAGIDAARRTLQELAVREQERGAAEVENREVVRRLSSVLAGGASKGRSGENFLREHLSELPPGMLVTDFRVGGKVVEFGLLLPDGRRLPIDSKWTAMAELEALEAAQDPIDVEACSRAVERAVVARAREVAQYLDPSVTAPVAVAAIPDAAYAALRRAHADAYSKGVIIVPYSSALPIVLFLYSLTQRFGDIADVQASLSEVAGLLESMDQVVENKFARAAVMLTNGADEFRSSLGKARGSIARARQPGPLPGVADELDEGQSLTVVR